MNIVALVAPVAALAGAGACGAVASRRSDQQSRRRQLGWILIALALCLRAVGAALWVHGGGARHSSPAAALQTLGTFALVVEPALLCLGLLFQAPTSSWKRYCLMALDVIVFTCCVATLMWWLLLEPHLTGGWAALARIGWSHSITASGDTLALAISLLAIGSLQSATNQPRLSLLKFQPWWLSGGIGLLALADYRFLWLAPRAGGTTFDIAILTLAPLLIGGAAIGELIFTAKGLLAHAAPESHLDALAKQNGQAPPAAPVESSYPEKSSATYGTTSHWLLLLPCIVALVGARHLSLRLHHTGALAGASNEAWWSALLVTVAVLRYALTSWHDTRRTTHGMGELQALTASLQDEVATRTHQIAALHAIAADLNRTLSCNQVLNAGLERMMDAIHADAGAVWVQLDFDSLVDVTDDQNQSGEQDVAPTSISSAAFLRREVERGDMERRVLESLKTESNGAANPTTDQDNGGQPSFAKRWRLVQTRSTAANARRAEFDAIHQALEQGDLPQAAQYCERLPATSGIAHVVPIHSKGEVMGAIALLRRQEAVQPTERAILESLALEVGAALQNAQLYQEALRLADRDSVTDLLNHRTIQQQFNACLARAQRTEGEFVVVIMDLNNFKFFNDTYGHPIGDKVLRTVADCLRESCRTSDILGRFGGDEFIALLLDTNAQGAMIVCSRIASMVEERAYQGGDDRRIPIGLAFGAAIFPQDGNTVLELLTVADGNLYEAKHGGPALMIKRSEDADANELRQLKDIGVGGSFGVLDALVTAIDNKDHYTRRHSEDVSHWSVLMSRELGYSLETQRAVRICGLLHDVGKIAVPDTILRKPGRLNDEEFQIMQQHPVFGALIVKDVPHLTDVLGGIRSHHERVDGRGYPDKLSGEDVPLFGRLLAVPDCFSAMTTNRPYRKALAWSEALDEIERGKGTQFDPQMADAFLEAMAKVVANNGQYPGADNGHQLPLEAAATATNSTADPSNGDGSDAVGDSSNDGHSLQPRSVADANTT